MGIYFMAGASATLTTAATAVHSVWASFSVRGFYRLRTSNKQKSWWEQFFLFVCCCRVAAHRVRRIPAICFLEQKICGGDGREQWEACSWCLRTLRLACGMWRPISDVAFRAFCAFPCVQSILESCVGRLFGVSIRQNSTSANRRWRHTKNLLFFCIIFFYMVKCNCVWGPPSGYE